MKKRILAGIGAVALVVAGALAVPTVAMASSAPTSPDGITDSRLCGSSNFEVDTGAFNFYAHVFNFKGAVYITGGTQRTWFEAVDYAGFPIGGYNFSVDCY